MAPNVDTSSFGDLRVAVMQPEEGAIAWDTAYDAKLVISRAGDSAPVLTLENQAAGSSLMQCIASARTAWRAGPALFFISPLPGGVGGMLYAVQCPSKAAADHLQASLEAAVAGPAAQVPSAAPAAGAGAHVAPAVVAPTPGDGATSGALSNGDTGFIGGTGDVTADGYAGGCVGRQNGCAPSPSRLLPPPSPTPPGQDGPRLSGSAAAGGSGAAPAVADSPGGAGGPGAGPGPPHGATTSSSPLHPGLSPLHLERPPPQQHPQNQHQHSNEAKEQHRGGGEGVRDGGVPAPTSSSGGGDGGGGGAASPIMNHFDRKICRASSDMYFHYYGMLQHQQNMLQDYTRTGTYYTAILGNPDDFRGRVVLDVGAGSGILSLFAAQAGAARVYAVEASGMARFARQLADANPALGARITVINSKVEELTLPERVDILVSEPMGTLLVNERMLESYIFARDAFLKPGGKMFPQLGRVHAAAFSDEVLHAEVAAKSAFWLQPSFYGVDVTALHVAATEGYFGQVVVDAFDPGLLVSSCATRALDFGTMPESELLDIDMPLNLVTGPAAPVTIHGLACWFDVFFAGAQQPVWLTTAPGMPTTHWFQLRCVLQQPLVVVAPNTRITGRLHLVAHARQSYDIYLTLTAPPLQPGQLPQTSSGKFDLKEPYYRQLTPYGAAAAAPTMTVQGAAMGSEAGASGGAATTVWGW